MTEVRKRKGRERLVEAAKHLLWETGYEQMSPGDVLARSGAGQGSLYHHFSGKLDLALTALQEIVAEESAAMDAIFSPQKPPADRLRDYLGRERQALRGCRVGRLANETAMELPEFRDVVAAYLGHVERLIADTVREGQAGGAFSPVYDPEEMGALFLSVIEGGFILARAHWSAERMRRALNGADIILQSLLRT